MKFRLIIDKNKDEEVAVTVHERNQLTDELEMLVHRFSGCDRLTAYSADGIKLLEFSDIEYVTVLDGKTYAIDRAGTRFRLKQRLYELEEILPSCFIRINKSTLANETRIERFAAAFSGAVDAVFRCGCREYVSRRCFAAIKRRYEER